MAHVRPTGPMVLPAQPPPETAAGRSLWQDAWRRLLRNRAAVASAIVLAAMALVSIFGPLVSPHSYDRVYPQYVRAPASLEAYPREDRIIPAFESAVARARVDMGPVEVDGTTVRAPISDDEALDPRIVRYVERSDLFDNVRIEELSDAGRSGIMVADVSRVRFLLERTAMGGICSRAS